MVVTTGVTSVLPLFSLTIHNENTNFCFRSTTAVPLTCIPLDLVLVFAKVADVFETCAFSLGRISILFTGTCKSANPL